MSVNHKNKFACGIHKLFFIQLVNFAYVANFHWMLGSVPTTIPQGVT